MEASPKTQPPFEQPPSSGRPLEFTFEGPGVARLSLMVTTVLEAMTAVDGAGSDKGARSS